MLCLLGVLVVLLPITAQEETSKKENFKKLLALEGSWKMASKKGFIVESWKRKSDQALEGMSYRINGTDSVLMERIDLYFNKAGMYFVPSTANQNNPRPVVFTLSSANNQMYIFENPEHDFPKRIVYHMISADSLHAYIDDGGSRKRANFYFKKQ